PRAAHGRPTGCSGEWGRLSRPSCRGPPLVMPALCRHPRCRRFRAMRERNPCVYIMASGFNGTLYIGVTSNLIGRIMQHRDGTFEGFTKRYNVKRLVWFDTADTMEVVIAAEKRIKKWPRD